MLKRLFTLLWFAAVLSAFQGVEVQAQCPSVGGQVTGGTTLCSGNPAPVLRLTGYDGTILRWERSTNNGLTWIIINHTSITYSPGVVSTPTLYRAVVRKSLCSPASSLPARIDISTAVSVGGTVSITSGSATVCSAADYPTMTLSGQTGSVVRWERSTNNGGSWQPLAITTTTYRPSQIDQSTWFRAVVQNGTCSEAFSAHVEVTVAGETSGGSITGTTQVCEDINAYTLTLVGHIGNVLNWESSTDDGVSWTTIDNQTVNLSGEDLATTTWFRAVVQSGNCPALFSAPSVLTVLPPSVAGTISATGTAGAENFICKGASAPEVVLTLNGFTGQVVRWQYRNGTDDWPGEDDDTDPNDIIDIDVQSNTLNLTTYLNGALIDLAQEGRAFRAIVRSNPCEPDTTDGIIITFEGECCQAPNPTSIRIADIVPDPDSEQDFTKCTVDFEWNPPTSTNVPTGYRFQYRAAGELNWIAAPDDAEPTQISIEGMRDGICYQVRLSSLCDDTPESSDTSVYSDFAQICICAPVKPEQLEAVAIDDNTMELSWFAQASNVQYQVFYRPALGTLNFQSVVTAEQRVVIGGLSPDTRYTWFVQKLCFDGDSYEVNGPNFSAPSDRRSDPDFFNTTGSYPSCDAFDFRWTKRDGSSVGNDFARSVTNDEDGYVYVLGEFQGTAEIGSFSLSSTTPGKNDLYVAKYDDNGTVVWATRIGSASDRNTDAGRGIAVDADGNVYVTGRFSGSTSFGNIVLNSAGNSDIFVARLRASDGTVLWARSAGGEGEDAGYGVDYDDFGNLYVTGSVTGTASFGSETTAGGAGQTDLFVAKYTNGGAIQWVRRAGNLDYGRDVARSVVTDLEGNAYVTGSVDGTSLNSTVTFGSLTLQNNSDAPNAFVAKFDPDGTVQYVTPITGSYSEGADIALDEIGNLYFVGAYLGRVDFGDDQLRSANQATGPNPSVDGFYAKLRATDGQPIWVRNVSGRGGDDYVRSVDVDAENNVFISGHFTSPVISINSGTLRNSGFETSDIFVAKINADGRPSGAKAAGSPDSDDASYGITVTDNGLAYAVGDFRSTATFGAETLTAQSSGWDAWVAQLSCVNPISCDVMPRNVFVSNVNQNTVSVGWDVTNPADVLEYEVRYRPLNRQTWEPAFKVPAPPATITGIFASTPYEVQVRAICDPAAGADKQGASLYTDPVRFETSVITECPVPTGLVVDNLFLNSAVITWNAVSGAARYVVSYRRVVGDLQWTELTTSSNSYTIGGLAQNTRYEVRVRSICTQELESPFTLPVRFSTLSGNCLEPQNVAATMITPNSAMISWLENSSAQNYQVQWRRVGSATWSSASVTTTSYQILNLLSDTEYEFRVRTICGTLNDASPYTPRQNFTTSPVCQVPDAVFVLNVTHNTAEISWTAVSGAVSYQVDFKPSNQIDWTSREVTANNISLTQLTPGVVYDVRVRTNCGNGNVTTFTPTRNFSTESFCEAPSSFSVIRLTATSIALGWVGPSNAVGYNLQYRELNGTWSAPVVLTSNFFEATSLSSDVTYEFRVYTICADGSASEYSTATVTTTPCAPPTSIEVVNITTNSARLTWTEVPGAVSYNLYLFVENLPQPVRIEQNIDATSFELTSLIEGVKYTVQITVECGEGESEPSSPVEFTTRRVCQTPTNVQVVTDRVTEVAAPIIWDAVDGAVSYIVYWKRNDAMDYTEQTVQANSFVLTGLQPNTEYVFYVRSNCGESNLSDPSQDVFFRTEEGSAGCFSPAIGNVVAGRTTAAVTWGFVPSAIQYTVSWRRTSINPPRWINVNIVDPTVTNYTIQNLVPGEEYEVRVRARCAVEVSDWSQETFMTQSLRDAFASTQTADWSVYPNPNNGQFQISFSAAEAGTASVQLMDVSGRSIFSRSVAVEAGDQTLPVVIDGYSAGVYLLVFECNGARFQQKLILN